MNTLIELKKTAPLLLITLTLYCFALLPQAPAVVPPPDGGYPGFTTAEGQNALFSLTTGVGNTAAGWRSLFANTTGSFNTAVGAGTLLLNTADQNTAIGAAALLLNTIGEFNTAVGVTALLNNTTGTQNTANGDSALFSNTTGEANTATGALALFSNTTGLLNTANGGGALYSNTTGSTNTATGHLALFSNTGGISNTAIGQAALTSNTNGEGNTAIGYQALYGSTAGSFNTALGVNAGYTANGSNNIHIGNPGLSTDDAYIRIGTPTQTKCAIAGIRDVTTAIADAIPVVIDSTFQLGTQSSSRRFKKEIKPMDKASEDILALKPVTFHYKSDKKDTPQFGLIAEEVAAVNPDLVVRDKNGEIYTVRYDAVNAMLLNEFLKEHRNVRQLTSTVAKQEATVAQQERKIQEQEITIAQLQTAMETVVTRLKKHESEIQTVSDQNRAIRSVLRLVASDQ